MRRQRITASRGLALACIAWLLLASAASALRAAESAASEALRGFLAAEWEWTLENHPTRASYLGDRRFNDRWPDVSLAGIERQHAHEVEALERLRATVDRAGLPPAEQLNYDLYAKQLENSLAGHRFRWFLCPVNQRGGAQTEDELADATAGAKPPLTPRPCAGWRTRECPRPASPASSGSAAPPFTGC